jgi:hypothetical protein
MLMLTASCANLDGVHLYYLGKDGQIFSFELNDTYIGKKTWLEVLREQFGDNQTFDASVGSDLKKFDLNQTITQKHFDDMQNMNLVRICITPNTPLVAQASAAATAAADAEGSLVKTFNTFTRYAPSAFAATVLAVVAYRYNFASKLFGFFKNVVTKRAAKILAGN